MNKRNLLNIIVSLLLVFSMLPFGSLAVYAEESGTGEPAEGEETAEEGLSKSKTSSKYELSQDDDTTEITLSLPSEEYLDTFDIVFVVDSSNESAIIEEHASELMTALLDEDLNVNIGVIKFKGRPQDTIDAVSDGSYSKLTALSDDTRSYIQEAIDMDPDTDPRSTTGNGTNLHSPLLLAQEWLEGSDTPDDHKYVLMFTDARSYIFDDGNGEPACIYTQYHRAGVTTNRLQYSGKPTVASNAQADKYHTGIMGEGYFIKDTDLDAQFRDKVVYFGNRYAGNVTPTHEQSVADFQALYDSTNSELTGDSPYQTTCYYVDTGTAKNPSMEPAPDVLPVSNFSTYFKSGGSLFQSYYRFNPDAEDPYLQLSPLEVECDSDGANCQYTGKLNEDAWHFHVSSEERSLYLSSHVWTDLGEKYHNIAIGNNRGYNAGLEMTRAFLEWLPENSELYAEVRKTSDLEKVFEELENQLIYAVGKAVVTDEIPDYLDLVEDAYDGIPFELTVGGEAQAPTEIAENDWGFGTPEDDVYPYEIVWDPDALTFTFYINVPVENANAVVLKYQLKWNGTGEEDTDVDTNVSTTIEYWPSNDPEGESTTEDYESPVVIYSEKEEPDPTPEPPTPFFPIEHELPRTGMGMPRAKMPASVNYTPTAMELMIPTLGLRSKIVVVEESAGSYPVEWLDNEVGLLADSAMPGKGAAIIAGHSTLNAEEYGPFAAIGSLEAGDRFFILSEEGGLQAYEVYANEKIGRNNFETLSSVSERYETTVTLLTCEDELASGGYASRRIISAKLAD